MNDATRQALLSFWSARVLVHGDIARAAVETLDHFGPNGGFEALTACLIDEVARRLREATAGDDARTP